MAGRVHLFYTSSSASINHTISFLPPLYSAISILHTHAARRSIYLPQTSLPRRPAHMFCTCSTAGDANLVSSSTPQSDPFVLTTPLYYVNAPPHMGSAYTTIAADAVARFQRLLGKKVIFITGTDEHGEKIATAAAASGSSPSDHCDAISQSYKALWNNLDIAYDRFIRTTDPQHEVIVKQFYSRVLAKGDIYRADYEGLYCINCEEYKDEKELIKDNCCPVHLKPCVARKEDNYFFALSRYQKKLEEILRKNPEFVQPASRLNEVRGWVNSGLRDFSISRAAVDWGIPVPNDNKQTIYVWFDALLGYVSALSEGEGQSDLDTVVSNGWPASLHLIGKDILRFHAVYWPAMLLSAGLSLPKTVFGHGFLTKDGMKMGKSLGNTIEPDDLVKNFGSDAVRYFFLKEVELGSDGDYSEDRFINSVNAGLANTIGNLLNRTLGLLKKNCESTLCVDSNVAAKGNPLKENVEDLVDKARDNYENLSLSSACDTLLEIANAGNLYMNNRVPWTGFKIGGDAADAAAKDLVVILEIMRILAITLSPVTPGLSLKIFTQLGFTKDQFNKTTWGESKWGGLKGGQVMSQPEPVFARIDKKTEGQVRKNSQEKAVKKIDKAPQTQTAAQS